MTSIKKVLEKIKVNDILFKWPNDIFYKNKKFCGVISESFTDQYNNSYIILGFGINMYSSPIISKYPTTFINSFCKNVEPLIFLYELFEILFKNLKILISYKENSLINYFNDNLMFLGENIKIEYQNKSIIEGKVVGANIDGSLKIKKNNKILNIYNGSIIL